MKIYTVVVSNYSKIYGMYSFKNREDAQELILSIAEESALDDFNFSIDPRWPGVATGEAVINFYRERAKVKNKSLELHLLDEAIAGTYIYENELQED